MVSFENLVQRVVELLLASLQPLLDAPDASEAPAAVQELWKALREKRRARGAAEDLLGGDETARVDLCSHVTRILESQPALLERLAQLISENAAQPKLEATAEDGSAIAQAKEQAASAAGQSLAVTGGFHLHLSQQGPAAAPGDPLPRFAQFLKRECAEWSLLPLAELGGDPSLKGEATLDQVYVGLNVRSEAELGGPREARVEMGGEEKPQQAIEYLRDHPYAVVLGDPGSGKSSLVRQISAWSAGRWLGKGRTDESWAEALFPIFTPLQDVAPVLRDCLLLPSDSAADKRRKLVDTILEHWRARIERAEGQCTTAELRQVIELGQVILVFDGLDELPLRDRGRIRDLLEALKQEFHGLRRLVVTCRVRSYVAETVLSGLDRCVLLPFNAEQIRSFAGAWYYAQAQLDRVSKEEARTKAEDLSTAALGDDLRTLAENPMLLTSMAVLHQKSTRLPRERVKIYDGVVDLLLRRWQERSRFPVSPELAELLKDPNKLRGLVEDIAYDAHKREVFERRADPKQAAENPALHRGSLLVWLDQPTRLGTAALAAEFLDYVDQRAGILIGAGGGDEGAKPIAYRFPHRTFQEYLAGCHMARERNVGRAFLSLLDDRERWSLVVELAGEELLYNKRDPKKLIEALYALVPGGAPAKHPAAVVWSGKLSTRFTRDEFQEDEKDNGDGLAYVDRLLPALRKALEDESGALRAYERVEAGRALAAWGDPREEVLDPTKMEFLEISAGSFRMGSNRGFESERPEHSVQLEYDFRIARFPVTVAQYHVFLRATSPEASPPWEPAQKSGHATCPATVVSWHQALAFCRWLEGVLAKAGRLRRGERVTLPSEAEWERTARGDKDAREFPWGDTFDPNRANCADTEIRGPSPVGAFPGGRSPCGAEEMAGNVWEWTRSLWGEDLWKPRFGYPYRFDDHRESLRASDHVCRVVRGGAFGNGPRLARCACRGWGRPEGRDADLGFRVALSPFPFSDL